MSERCLVCEASEKMERLLKEFGPSEEVTGHFRQSGIEFLKGLRSLLDERIEQMSRPAQKGERLTVE